MFDFETLFSEFQEWLNGSGLRLGLGKSRKKERKKERKEQKVNRVLAIRFVQWLGWVFETQERKKEKVCRVLAGPETPRKRNQRFNLCSKREFEDRFSDLYLDLVQNTRVLHLCFGNLKSQLDKLHLSSWLVTLAIGPFSNHWTSCELTSYLSRTRQIIISAQVLDPENTCSIRFSHLFRLWNLLVTCKSSRRNFEHSGCRERAVWCRAHRASSKNTPLFLNR